MALHGKDAFQGLKAIMVYTTKGVTWMHPVSVQHNPKKVHKRKSKI